MSTLAHNTRNLLCLCILLVASFFSKTSYAGSAYTLPQSNNLIYGILVLPTNTITFFLRDGEMLKFMDSDYYYGLTPTINGGDISFYLSAISLVGSEEKVEVIGQDHASAGKALVFRNHRFSVTVLNILHHSFPEAQQAHYIARLSPRSLEEAMALARCCISVASFRVCATVVHWKMGNCTSSPELPKPRANRQSQFFEHE